MQRFVRLIANTNSIITLSWIMAFTIKTEMGVKRTVVPSIIWGMMVGYLLGKKIFSKDLWLQVLGRSN